MICPVGVLDSWIEVIEEDLLYLLMFFHLLPFCILDERDVVMHAYLDG